MNIIILLVMNLGHYMTVSASRLYPFSCLHMVVQIFLLPIDSQAVVQDS
jgi:hypothetical protein